jgi:hypothetical protein
LNGIGGTLCNFLGLEGTYKEMHTKCLNGEIMPFVLEIGIVFL